MLIKPIITRPLFFLNFQNGFHAKETCCINPLTKINEDNIFISGGEDGILRVTRVSNVAVESNFSFRTLGIFNGHISSIRSIVSLNLRSNFSSNKYLVFTGGGRAQIKVWEIDIKTSESSSEDTNITCRDIASHMLYEFDRSRKKQPQGPNQSYIVQPETRYMDIEIYRDVENLNYVVVFVACADGFVR